MRACGMCAEPQRGAELFPGLEKRQKKLESTLGPMAARPLFLRCVVLAALHAFSLWFWSGTCYVCLARLDLSSLLIPSHSARRRDTGCHQALHTARRSELTTQCC